VDPVPHAGGKSKRGALHRIAARDVGDGEAHLHEFAVPGLLGARDPNHDESEPGTISKQGKF
jgi:hypothetical protein